MSHPDELRISNAQRQEKNSHDETVERWSEEGSVWRPSKDVRRMGGYEDKPHFTLLLMCFYFSRGK